MADRVEYTTTSDNLNVRFSQEITIGKQIPPMSLKIFKRQQIKFINKKLERYKTQREKAKGTRRMANVEQRNFPTTLANGHLKILTFISQFPAKI